MGIIWTILIGFIVGLGERTVLIATAEHTLEHTTDDPQVCFVERPDACSEGKVVYLDDPRASGDPDAMLLDFFESTYAAAAETVAAGPAYVYSYNPVGRRDPFRSPIQDMVRENTPANPQVAACNEPLCQWDIDQLKLVAVVTGDATAAEIDQTRKLRQRWSALNLDLSGFDDDFGVTVRCKQQAFDDRRRLGSA